MRAVIVVDVGDNNVVLFGIKTNACVRALDEIREG